ncbi:MAG: hypothetical protein R3A79_13600 [Nannocystaceae bacterium]
MSCSAAAAEIVAVAPPKSTTGDCASWAFLTAVIVFVRPGPAVIAAIWGRPSGARPRRREDRVRLVADVDDVDAARLRADEDRRDVPAAEVKSQRTPCLCKTSVIHAPPSMSSFWVSFARGEQHGCPGQSTSGSRAATACRRGGPRPRRSAFALGLDLARLGDDETSPTTMVEARSSAAPMTTLVARRQHPRVVGRPAMKPP